MKKLLIWLFNLQTCKKCGGIDLKRGYYASGWNHLCNQASGDRGVICSDCFHIEFDKSLEQRKAESPSWVETKH